MKKRVLIADDDVCLRTIFSTIVKRKCEQLGTEVIVDEACDGSELIKKVLASNSNYDLILTDNQMPRMSGLEAIRRIRLREPNLLIYMVSASDNGDGNIVRKAIDMGATGYIDKGKNIYQIIENTISLHLR